MKQVSVVLYGRGGTLGNFEVFARDLATTLRAEGKQVVVQNTERGAAFFNFLASPPFLHAARIAELHVFSHSIGAGLLSMVLCGCGRPSKAPSEPARTPEVLATPAAEIADATPPQDTGAARTRQPPECTNPAAPLTIFERACFVGDLAKVQAELASQPLDNPAEACRPTPLMLALSPYIGEPNAKASVEAARAQRKSAIAQLLLDGGANPKAVDDNAMTVLHYAASAYIPEPLARKLVKQLLDRGADANARTTGGQTPLLMALPHRRPAIVRTLLEGGADPSLAALSGEVPAEAAARLGDEESAREIRQWLAKPKNTDASMQAPESR